jgi:preprotein translocase subunit YajC
MTTMYLLAAAPQAAPSFLNGMVVPMVVIGLIFYFLLLRPEAKRRKALEQLIDSLKKGDKVVTSGGLYGEVVKAEDATVILKLAENVKVRVARRAIAGLEGSPEDKGGQ